MPDEAASHVVDVPVVVDVDGAVAEFLEGAGQIFKEEHFSMAFDYMELAVLKRKSDVGSKRKARKFMNVHVRLLRITGDRAQPALIGGCCSDAFQTRKAGIVPAGRPKRFGRDGVEPSLEFVQETKSGLMAFLQRALLI